MSEIEQNPVGAELEKIKIMEEASAPTLEAVTEKLKDAPDGSSLLDFLKTKVSEQFEKNENN